MIDDEPTPATDPRPPVLHGEIPIAATPLGELELAAVLRDGHTHVLGDPPPALVLGVAWAHAAEEHRRGLAIWCHNIGNITADPHWPGDYYAIRWQKKHNPHDAPDHLGPDDWFSMRFRAHDDFIDGARNYWELISNSHFHPVLDLYARGDAYDAGMKLKALGYYTADATPYSESMRWLYGYFAAHVLPKL